MRSWGGERMQRRRRSSSSSRISTSSSCCRCRQIVLKSLYKATANLSVHKPVGACKRMQKEWCLTGEGGRERGASLKWLNQSSDRVAWVKSRLNVRLCGLEAKETRLTDRPRSVLRGQRPATLWRDSCSQSSSSTICARSRKA